MDNYWSQCNATVEAVKTQRPDTTIALIALLRSHDPMSDGISGDAFWSASNGGDELWPLLMQGGWRFVECEADYFWTMRHPRTHDVVQYIEGDVYDRTPAED